MSIGRSAGKGGARERLAKRGEGKSQGNAMTPTKQCRVGALVKRVTEKGQGHHSTSGKRRTFGENIYFNVESSVVTGRGKERKKTTLSGLRRRVSRAMGKGDFKGGGRGRMKNQTDDFQGGRRNPCEALSEA